MTYPHNCVFYMCVSQDGLKILKTVDSLSTSIKEMVSSNPFRHVNSRASRPWKNKQHLRRVCSPCLTLSPSTLATCCPGSARVLFLSKLSTRLACRVLSQDPQIPLIISREAAVFLHQQKDPQVLPIASSSGQHCCPHVPNRGVAEVVWRTRRPASPHANAGHVPRGKGRAAWQASETSRRRN